MGSKDDYRDKAHECMQAADRTYDPARKVSLLELAGRWLRLAEQVHDRRGLTGDALIDPQVATTESTDSSPAL
jgi:hypothetical protein